MVNKEKERGGRPPRMLAVAVAVVAGGATGGACGDPEASLEHRP